MSFSVNEARLGKISLGVIGSERKIKMMILSRGLLLNFDFYIHLNINSYSSNRMKAEFYSILIVLIFATPIQNAAFNITGWSRHGSSLKYSTCNKDTLIDFGFTSNTQITCTSGGCTTV